ncbi:hypothetical protein AGRA3207_006102 [Actinomadura graeca]|uniref:Uncharacterized protein n=1 Tax=Actinomadura graeca TaxID=2750812 RepID=A0ABX8R0Y6_9ACTN|nr:hypothetical protein [Actinomadura graeca]QXJ24720.1 hypothetical protein AGRA3207_006102 [Actinomadura graeca]
MWSIPVPLPGNPLGGTIVDALETSRGPEASGAWVAMWPPSAAQAR